MAKNFSRSKEREERDDESRWAREEGFSKPKHSKVAKIAYNRLYVPSEEPPKWYKDSSLTSEREDAVKSAANLLRTGAVQYAKVYREWTEDGVMWGVKTYPRVIPWYIKEGLVPDNEEDRKKTTSRATVRREFKQKPSFTLTPIGDEYSDYDGRIYTKDGTAYSLRKKTSTQSKIKRAFKKTDKKLKQVYGLENVGEKAEKVLSVKTKKKSLDTKAKKVLAASALRKKKPQKKVVKRRK